MSSKLQTVNRQNALSVWAGRVADCRNSGLPVKTWCKENGICEQTYYRWQKRVFQKTQEHQSAHFVEVNPEPAAARDNVAVVVRLGGAEAEICNGADRSVVETVLRFLSQC